MQNKKKYFESLYDMYHKQIFRFVYFRVNNSQTAEDITAETFLKVWKKIQKGLQIDNERALLYVIARGILIDYYRSHALTKEYSLDELSDTMIVLGDEMLHRLSLKEEIETLYKKLVRLKKEYQEIILLRYVQDLNYAEIASIMNKKEGAIRVLVHRALTALKKYYE